jgi:hypothetical protein
MEYGLLERANLIWKTLEQMYGSSNDKRLSSNVLENISLSIHIVQDPEEQSNVQKEEKVKSASLRKPDGLILA